MFTGFSHLPGKSRNLFYQITRSGKSMWNHLDPWNSWKLHDRMLESTWILIISWFDTVARMIWGALETFRTISYNITDSVFLAFAFILMILICYDWFAVFFLSQFKVASLEQCAGQVCWTSLLSRQNVRLLHHMLPPGESWWVCWRDRQMDRYQTVT